jgi:hypothetical protein
VQGRRRAMPDDRMETALGHLVGPREEFRKILSDAPGILRRICRIADSQAKYSSWQRLEPWQFISKWTGHGSGVSKAIYELYKENPDAT